MVFAKSASKLQKLCEISIIKAENFLFFSDFIKKLCKFAEKSRIWQLEN